MSPTARERAGEEIVVNWRMVTVGGALLTVAVLVAVGIISAMARAPQKDVVLPVEARPKPSRRLAEITVTTADMRETAEQATRSIPVPEVKQPEKKPVAAPPVRVALKAKPVTLPTREEPADDTPPPFKRFRESGESQLTDSLARLAQELDLDSPSVRRVGATAFPYHLGSRGTAAPTESTGHHLWTAETASDADRVRRAELIRVIDPTAGADVTANSYRCRQRQRGMFRRAVHINGGRHADVFDGLDVVVRAHRRCDSDFVVFQIGRVGVRHLAGVNIAALEDCCLADLFDTKLVDFDEWHTACTPKRLRTRSP